jgi:hypothetical protein
LLSASQRVVISLHLLSHPSPSPIISLIPSSISHPIYYPI